jgi:hypothetical protein
VKLFDVFDVRVGLLVSLVLTLAACGPGGRGDDDDDDSDGGTTQCTTGQNVCVGNEVHECSNGVPGALIETCGDGMACSNGSCVSSSACGVDGVELIYVVDSDYNLWSFEPRNDAHTFASIGSLNCPNPGVDLRDGFTTATPFSMSVDRNGVAWVLYTSGKLFRVSTSDASCQESTWSVGAGGFQLFGMGFVVDQSGGNTEKLWISGGLTSELDTGASDLGSIDTSSMTVGSVGPMPNNGEYSPELSGTGAAELYAYYPGSQSSFVARIAKATGQVEQQWNLQPLGDGFSSIVVAWAFAHWGGRFYIFATVQDAFSGANQSMVIRLDPEGNGGQGSSQTILPNTGRVVVGAGVSTCAPIIVD